MKDYSFLPVTILSQFPFSFTIDSNLDGIEPGLVSRKVSHTKTLARMGRVWWLLSSMLGEVEILSRVLLRIFCDSPMITE